MPAPHEIKIELTRDCVLACIHCSSLSLPGSALQLDLDAVQGLVRQAAQTGTESVVLSGGEPLVWPWLPQAVEECATRGVECTIYTTGIDRAHGVDWPIRLRNLGLRRAVFSLYSAEKTGHERITRISGSFRDTVRAIRVASDAGVETGIHFVPLRRNLRQLADLTDLAEECGVSRVSVLRLVPHGRGAALKASHEMLGHRETLWLRNEILRLRGRNRVEIRAGSPYNILMLGGPTPCSAGGGTLIVLPNGHVYPCDAFKNIESLELRLDDPYGNVLAAPLVDCWQKSIYLSKVRLLVSQALSGPCAACPHVERCQSGCLAQKLLYYGIEGQEAFGLRPDPLCLRHLMEGGYQ